MACLCMAAAALPIMMGDLWLLKVHRNPEAGFVARDGKRFGLRWFGARPTRIAVKLLGLYATLGVIFAIYSTVPEYNRDYFDVFWRFIQEYAIYFVLISIPYIIIVDGFMRDAHDEYWHAGRFFLFRWKGLDVAILKNYAMSWAIKAFFLPIMFVPLTKTVVALAAVDWTDGFPTFIAFFSWFVKLVLAINLTFVTVGYVLTLRLFDYHIRSPNPYLLAWVSALACYVPFWTVIGGRLLKYNDGDYWWGWFNEYELFAYSWGFAIMLLQAVWVWQIVTFGCRFSNLTHRGILTNGPFRFTKHPSYISKNLFWWMVSVPFLSSQGPLEALSNCVLLFGVNVIYFIRARTEEKHLSLDPTYVEYAMWMEQHGIFRRVGQIIPWLSYKPPPGWPETGSASPSANVPNVGADRP
jgi:hypothetical protein